MERVVLFGLAKRNARKGIPAHPEKVGNILVALAFVDQARRGASIASLGRARHAFAPPPRVQGDKNKNAEKSGRKRRFMIRRS